MLDWASLSGHIIKTLLLNKAAFQQYLSAYFIYYYGFHIVISISILKIDNTRNIMLNKSSIIYNGSGGNLNNHIYR